MEVVACSPLYRKSHVLYARSYKILRVLLAAPSAIVYLIIFLSLFDLVHHILGLAIHLILAALILVASLVTFRWYGFELPKEFWDLDSYGEHLHQLVELGYRYQEHGTAVLVVFGVWLILVATFALLETVRIGVRGTLATIIRDQKFIISMILFVIKIGLEGLLIFVQWSLRVLTNEELLRSLRRAVKDAGNK